MSIILSKNAKKHFGLGFGLSIEILALDENSCKTFISNACYAQGRPSEMTEDEELMHYAMASKLFNFDGNDIMFHMIDGGDFIFVSDGRKSRSNGVPSLLLIDPVERDREATQQIFANICKSKPKSALFVIEINTDKSKPRLISIEDISELAKQYNAKLMGSISLAEVDPNTAIITENIALECLNAKLVKELAKNPLDIAKKPLHNPLDLAFKGKFSLLCNWGNMESILSILPNEISKFIVCTAAQAVIKDEPMRFSNFYIKNKEAEQVSTGQKR